MKIKPFKATKYNSQKVMLEKVISPPYDECTTEVKQKQSEDPLNSIHLIIPEENINQEHIKKVKQKFKQLIKEKVLIEDEEALYWVKYKYKNKQTVNSIEGLIALGQISQDDEGIILPHEKTMKNAIEKQVNWIENISLNTSQIYVLYNDQKQSVKSLIKTYIVNKEAEIKIKLSENLSCEYYKITNKKIIEKCQNELKNKKVIIANGHHRYKAEQVLTKKKKKKRETLFFLVNENQESNLIAPIHRLIDIKTQSTEKIIEKLSEIFQLTLYNDMNKMLDDLSQKNRPCIGTAIDNHIFILQVNNQKKLNAYFDQNEDHTLKKTETNIIEKIILKEILAKTTTEIKNHDGIEYLTNIQEIMKKIKENKNKIAFFVKPIPVKQLRKITEKGLKFPEKTTYFYPKLWTGLLFHYNKKD